MIPKTPKAGTARLSENAFGDRQSRTRTETPPAKKTPIPPARKERGRYQRKRQHFLPARERHGRTPQGKAPRTPLPSTTRKDRQGMSAISLRLEERREGASEKPSSLSRRRSRDTSGRHTRYRARRLSTEKQRPQAPAFDRQKEKAAHRPKPAGSSKSS